MHRNTSISWLLVAACACPAAAQTYPTKPIRFIAPFAPGGGTDLIGRVLAQKIAEGIGHQVIVDNRPGAGGTLGAELGAKAPPDGYTFTVISGSYTVNPSLYKLSFDPASDITPVIQFSAGPFLVAVHPSVPVRNIKELIAMARAKPGAINYASSGQGSITHLATELFLDMAKISIQHIPYKGTAPALTETIAGQTSVLFGSVSATLPQVKNKRLRGIAVTTKDRIAADTSIPTVAESGLPGYEVVLWHGLIGPKGVQRPIVDRINAEANRSLKNKDVIERLSSDGVSPAGGTPEQFGEQIRRDIAVWSRIVKKAGIKAE